MSKWTHVLGVIEYSFHDDIPSIEKLNKSPFGKEGSINYNISTVVKDERVIITVFGHLRDYDNIKEITEYFISLVHGYAIEDIILQIEVEYDKRIIYKYNKITEAMECINMQQLNKITNL
jgi:hypothetical protein